MSKAGGRADKPEGGRGADRDSMFLRAELRLVASGESGEVRVRNLSPGGLMAEAPMMARRGEVVEIELRNVGWVSAKIAWAAEGRFGIAFDCPIDPRDVRRAQGPNLKLPPYLQKLNRPPQPIRARRL